MNDYYGNPANQPEHCIDKPIQQIVESLYDGFNDSENVGTVIGNSLIQAITSCWDGPTPRQEPVNRTRILEFLVGVTDTLNKEVAERKKNCKCLYGTYGSYGQPKGKYLCLGCGKIYNEKPKEK